ncbi:MAG: protease HtpX [Gammaproteobacteria bacterium]|nr:protease HtpX [Gammaproteobacteria bacterium]MBT8110514.1 protease HtpX [Gammaproteobacteria bacterium]NND46390.1 protease HtpX [Woeseiaceae bacterium]NNL45214.1 protease HtpX [Woeseiaceae bacterium]
MFKRVALFLATNLAIILVLSIVLRLLGVDSILDERNVGIDYQSLLILSLVIGFGGSFISLAISKWMAKRSTGARVITQPSNAAESWLVATVERQARQAGIETPEIAIYDSPDMNAFATGARRNAALVAVSTGLLNSMPKDEVEAVLAHEISHVANGDMVTLTLIQGVVNTFVIFLSRIVGHFVDRVILKNDRGYGLGYFAAVIVSQLLLGILASMIVMWVSRLREFRADAGSANLNGREPMINALARLERGRPGELPEALQAFGISGGAKKKMSRLFMSHPPIQERIEALRRL